MSKISSYKKIVKRILLFVLIIILVLIFIPITVGIYYFKKADFKSPNDSICLEKYAVHAMNDSIKYVGQDLLHLNSCGIWEIYISGSPIERGAKYGILTKDLLRFQENVFVEQI